MQRLPDLAPPYEKIRSTLFLDTRYGTNLPTRNLGLDRSIMLT